MRQAQISASCIHYEVGRYQSVELVLLNLLGKGVNLEGFLVGIMGIFAESLH